MTRRPLVALAGLWLAICGTAAVWLTVNRRPSEWDHANQLERAVDCYRNPRIVTDSGAPEILEASSFYPPLATCAAGALYLVFPITPLTGQVVMMGFLALALASVYGLGRRLADVETGLWAAFLLATAPFVVFSLTTFPLDLPLAAMGALTLYAILRAEDFGRPGWSLALGAAVGLGMLTNPPFAAYVGPPLLWSLGRALASSERRRRLLWAAGALAMGAALALPWYGPRLFGLPAQMLNRSFKQAAEQQNPDSLTAAALSFYPRTLPTQLGLIAALLLLWGLWALGKEGRTTRGFLWLATLGPFVLFSVSNFRYEVVRRGLPYRMTRSWTDAPLGVDFVVLKTGAQGPSYAAARPERISRAFTGGDPYWMSAFPVIAEYPLPDGSTASLRARRIPPLVGVRPLAVAERLERDPAALLADNVDDAQGLKVRLEYRPQGILRGEIDRAVLTADSAFVGEFGRRRPAPLRMRDIWIEGKGLVFNPQRLMREGRLEIL